MNGALITKRNDGTMRHELKLVESLDGLETALISLSDTLEPDDDDVEVVVPLGRVPRRRLDFQIHERLSEHEHRETRSGSDQ